MSRRTQANAEKPALLPRQFDCVTIGFGLRNVTDKAAALADMRSMLRPGGQLIVLEFSQLARRRCCPSTMLTHSTCCRRLGELVAGDAESYRYLAESIRKHPDQETLLGMMRDAGLEDCSYQNLSAGHCRRAPRATLLMLRERTQAIDRPHVAGTSRASARARAVRRWTAAAVRVEVRGHAWRPVARAAGGRLLLSREGAAADRRP